MGREESRRVGGRTFSPSLRKKVMGVVSLAEIESRSRREGISRREVEISLLEQNLIPERYERNIGTWGVEGQLRLARSRALVAGCGGLGGVIIEVLARAGVGRLTVVDGDSFVPSNLNRQLLAMEKNLGANKAQVAQLRALEVNGSVDVRVVTSMLTEQNCEELLDGQNIALDALDSNWARKILYSGCEAGRIPVIHGAIGGMVGQVGRFLPWERTHFDLFEGKLPDQGMEVVAGTPSCTPFVIGAMEASEALTYLSGCGPVAWGTLTCVDLTNLSMETLEL
jgi:molybdopterin/thiamine biosynthesis adenylyltransferase